MRPPSPRLAALALLALARAAARPAALHAQQPGAPPVCVVDSEAPIRRMRAGLGAAVGGWHVRDLAAPPGGTASASPSVEAYFARGLDLHLALEQSIVFWRRAERVAPSEVTSYLIGQLTSLRAYPFTRPTARLEPWLRAGAGFTVGIEDRGDVPDPRTGATGTSLVPGLGLVGGAGLEWHATRAFGLGAGVDYRWFRYFEEGVAGRRVYQGVAVAGGVSYRFQFH
jgi:hypothetical protein